jgi:hypothetical protein
MQQFTGEIIAHAAVFQFFGFTADFYRAAGSPEWLVNIDATLAVHLIAITAFAAQYAAS